jgi:hypothetical protein
MAEALGAPVKKTTNNNPKNSTDLDMIDILPRDSADELSHLWCVSQFFRLDLDPRKDLGRVAANPA